MTVPEFLQQLRAEVSEALGSRLGGDGQPYPYAQSVFAEIVMRHMADIGMTFDFEVCHYSARAGVATVAVSGYAWSDDNERLDLFLSLYSGAERVTDVSDDDTKSAAECCLQFFARCASGELAALIDRSNDVFDLATKIRQHYRDLEQIRIYVLTDRRAAAKFFQPREVAGKRIKLEVMDIERLCSHLSEGRQMDELVLNFEQLTGDALPCVYIPGVTGTGLNAEYDYALAAVPAEALQFVYDRFGERLLDANVRSFLNTHGKVNKGIRDTLLSCPDRFVAYNNGLVIVAEEAGLAKTRDGAPGLAWLKGVQIVNGGQTTASLYFARRRDSAIDLSRVRVSSKIIILRSCTEESREELIAQISRYANTQNAVKQSDLASNRPFHQRLEALSMTVFCPDNVGRWFYERAAGSYQTMLAREGTTPTRRKQLKQVIPSSRVITKTDLAKVVHAWEQKPFFVSLGAEKNFQKFMESFHERGWDAPSPFMTDADYRTLIAKAILFRAVGSVARSMFQAFQANVAAYAVSLLANRVGNIINLDQVWSRQALSRELEAQVRQWCREVHEVLTTSARTRMVSEWAKKEECWTGVRDSEYSDCGVDIPELTSR